MNVLQKAVSDTSVVTGQGRGSYVSIFTPRLNELSGKEEYSMSFLISKDDKDTIRNLNDAVEAATVA